MGIAIKIFYQKQKTVSYIYQLKLICLGMYFLNIETVFSTLFKDEKLILSAKATAEIEESFLFLRGFSESKVIYGINTGFGPMAQYRVDDNHLKDLQYNIIRSHATGAGRPLEPILVKAAMIARLGTFMQAKSGVHPELPTLLIELINRDISPYVPEHGGVGASGDLVQLAHIALALIGEGEVFYKGELRVTRDVLEECRLRPIKMHIREGLSFTNGTSVMTGIGIVNLYHSKRVLDWSIAASAMINEIASSYDDFMSEALNNSRRHPGQGEVAGAMRMWCADSRCLRRREDELYNEIPTESTFKQKVQPYYSLRCVPQILGPVLETIRGAGRVLEDEINSVCDNPIVDRDSGNVYHGGNFHGDYVSFEMDKLKIAITKLTMLCERQLNYLMHDKINGILPPFVNLGVLGLNYGLQAGQFTATSTTAESQTLSFPMYLHSIPNNNDNQDVVSMGTNSALIAKRVIDNSFQVIAILMIAISQAVEYLKIEDKVSSHSCDVLKIVRGVIPIFVEDMPKYREIDALSGLLKNWDIGINV